jgi:putative heme-binding domain-containing protein
MFRFLLCYCTLLVSTGFLSADQAPTPHWIVTSNKTATTFRLARSIRVDEAIQVARLKIACDFASAKLAINDSDVLVVEPYCQLQSMDVTKWMALGENRFSIVVTRANGPSAVAIEIELLTASGQKTSIQSDESWNVVEENKQTAKARSVGKVRPEFWGIGRRDISLSPVENYEQWRQATNDDKQSAVQPKFWTVPGFELTLLRTATADEGSWIALAFDSQGRAIISREDQGLLRVTLDEERKSVEKVSPIQVDVKECRGLVFEGEDLYANANNSKAIYQLRLTEDGRADSVVCLREFPGTVGHGRNDLTIDGKWLYSIHGDSVDLPTSNVTDLTSPVRNWSGDASQRQGQLMRMNIVSRQWELVVGGLRNPYGIAANPSGELFTFDADNEYDMGTPWYRPTRVLAMAFGGDVGYRTAGNKMPPRFHDQPENLPPVVTIGRSSPTAVFCDPKLNFPATYRDSLYLLDWTYGRVIAVHLTPRGAGWRAQTELFLQGRPLNVTDVAGGPDGAMYLITGGRKTQSSFYRIAWKNSESNVVSDHITEHEQASLAFSQTQKQIRTELEQASRSHDASALPAIVKQLSADDPIVRHAARIALERMPGNQWHTTITNTTDERTWLYGTLAIAQSNRMPGRMIERWLACKVVDFNLSDRVTWVRLCELCVRSGDNQVQERRQAVIEKLIAHWPKEEPICITPHGTTVEFRQRLALLLGTLKATQAIELVSRDLFTSPLQEDRLAGLLAMRDQRDGWTIEQRRAQWQALNDTGRMIGGEGLPSFIESIRTESLATLSAQERENLKDLIDTKNGSVFEELPTRAVVRKWQIEDLKRLASAPVVEGDRKNGAKIYREALCIRCHRIGNEGKSVGPDLSFVSRRFSPRDLLESMLSPSKSVAENYRLDVIVTQSGSVHTGRMLVEGDYRSTKIKLQTDALRANSVVEIDKSEIEEHRPSDRSPMPDGLLDAFREEEIRDLIAYLQEPN